MIRDRVQGPVSAAVEAVSGVLAAAGFQGCDSGQRGEGRFASDPSGVGPADQQLGRNDRSHAGFSEQCRPRRVFLDQAGQLGIDVRELAGQEPYAGGDGLHGQDRDPVFDRGSRGGGRAFDQGQKGGQRAAAQGRPPGIRGDHDEAFEFVDGLGAADQNRLAGRGQGPDRFTEPADAGTGLVLPRHRGGSPDRIEPVVLRTAGAFECLLQRRPHQPGPVPRPARRGSSPSPPRPRPGGPGHVSWPSPASGHNMRRPPVPLCGRGFRRWPYPEPPSRWCPGPDHLR